MGWYSSVCEIGLIYDMYDIPIDTEIAINSAEEQNGESFKQPRCFLRGVSLLCHPRGLSEFQLFAVIAIPQVTCVSSRPPEAYS